LAPRGRTQALGHLALALGVVVVERRRVGEQEVDLRVGAKRMRELRRRATIVEGYR